MKKAVIALSIVLSLLLIYATWISVKYYTFTPEVISKSDTITIHSVDTVEVEKETISDHTKLIAHVDTIYVRDTILITDSFVYEDSIATIQYSGINPKIDAIEYRIPVDTIRITTENTIIRPERKLSFGLSVGPAIGYGVGIDQSNKVVATPFIGISLCVGLNYKIK